MAAEQPHRRDLPEDKRLDQIAVSEFGRLFLHSQISVEQHDAGERYAKIVGRYRATIEGPSAVSGSGRGYECDNDCDPEVPCECSRRRTAYMFAFEALMTANRHAGLVVNRVVIHDEPCGTAEEFLELCSGLNALASHFGLTTHANKRMREIENTELCLKPRRISRGAFSVRSSEP